MTYGDILVTYFDIAQYFILTAILDKRFVILQRLI
jgi:hypothetical protein